MTEQEAIRAISTEGINIQGPARRMTEFFEGMTIAEKALEEIQLYRSMEERLEAVYGSCDGLLETVVAGLEKHEKINFQKPVKSRLLTDEHVDMWESYKEIGTPEEFRAAVEEQKETRNKAIDDFTEKIIRYVDCGHLCFPTEIRWSDLDVVEMIKKLAEQLKGGGSNE